MRELREQIGRLRMTKDGQARTAFIFFLLFAAFLASGQSTEKQEKQKLNESYAAIAMVTRGAAAGTSVHVTLYVDEYSSNDELHQLAQTLRTKGPDALRDAMDKMDKGRIASAGSVGTAAAVVRKRPTKTGYRIVMVTGRPIGFLEARHGGRSRDYQFTVVELQLDATGKGTGTLMVGTKIYFNKKDELVFEHYGIEPVKLVNVYLNK